MYVLGFFSVRIWDNSVNPSLNFSLTPRYSFFQIRSGQEPIHSKQVSEKNNAELIQLFVSVADERLKNVCVNILPCFLWMTLT